MDKRRIARAQHNQVEKCVRDQLALVTNAHFKAYWFREQRDNIYPQIDFIVAQRYGTVEFLAELIIQIKYFNKVPPCRVSVGVIIANIIKVISV